MEQKKVAVLVGSLRRESLNRKMARALIQLAPETLDFAIIEIGDLPHYNQDFDDRPFPSWVAFREQIKNCDGVLFVTPEYNRSVPGVLKNALDVGSRPYGSSVWEAKPCAVISVSPGAVGGFGANHHLRQSLVFLNMPTMPQPEAYIGNAGRMFSQTGEIENPETRQFAKKIIDAFAVWLSYFPRPGLTFGQVPSKEAPSPSVSRITPL